MDPETLIDVQYRSTSQNLVLRNVELQGEGTAEMTLEDYPHVASWLESELKEIAAVEKTIAKRRAELAKTLDASGLSDAAKEAKLAAFDRDNNPSVTFYKLHGRTPKPLRELTILRTKGLKPTRENREREERKQLQAALMGQSSNQDMKTLIGLLAKSLGVDLKEDN